MTEWALNLAFLALCFGAVLVNFGFGPVDKPVDPRAPVRVRRRQPPPPPQQPGGKRE